MRNAIAVVNLMGDDSPKRVLYDLSLRSIQQYAQRIGVPLVMITNRDYSLAVPKVPHLEKLQAIDLLDYYDRVLCLDLDILVNPLAPDIFKAYPWAHLTYGYDEGYLSWIADDVRLFEKRFKVDFPPGQGDWKRLLNGGVMLWSQSARVISKLFDPEQFYASFDNTAGEQSWVNTMMVAHDVKCGYLDQKWNWCPYADAAHYPNRLHANFIHYASDGEWIGQQPKVQQIQDDVRALGLRL